LKLLIADDLARRTVFLRPLIHRHRLVSDMIDNVVGFVLGFIDPKKLISEQVPVD
jgi:hypothetical protein